MGKMFAKDGFFVCVLVLTLGFLPLYGCGGGGGDTEEFSCELTRSITSGSMSMSVTYDCPDEASCNACTGDDGDCSGCRKVSPEDMGTPGDGDGTPPGSMPDSNDDVECAVGLELMAGESCSFDDGQNRFTINNTGDSCCIGGICAGRQLDVNNVVVMRNAEGDCVVESLP